MELAFSQYGLEGLTRTILSFGHLVGLVLGLGTTVYLDGGCFLSIARKSWDGYRSFMSGTLFAVATKYVTVGLCILWVTGCGFLIHYDIFAPEKLANPKLYAKFAFVTVLTVNGYILHRHVLGRVAKMRDSSHLLKSNIGPLCLLSGAVSSASWASAFLLGALPILNNVVEFSQFVAVWALLVVAAYLCARLLIALHGRGEPATAPQDMVIEFAAVMPASLAGSAPMLPRAAPAWRSRTPVPVKTGWMANGSTASAIRAGGEEPAHGDHGLVPTIMEG